MRPPNQTIQKHNAPPLIFVVDDNRQLIEMAEMVLTAEGYQCKTFSDPAQALEAFKKSDVIPDLLLTDYEMGPMNGLELIARCRQTQPNLKTVLLSGTIQLNAVLLQPVKVNHFLSKPYQPQQLVALVKSLLAE